MFVITITILISKIEIAIRRRSETSKIEKPPRVARKLDQLAPVDIVIEKYSAADWVVDTQIEAVRKRPCVVVGGCAVHGVIVRPVIAEGVVGSVRLAADAVGAGVLVSLSGEGAGGAGGLDGFGNGRGRGRDVCGGLDGLEGGS